MIAAKASGEAGGGGSAGSEAGGEDGRLAEAGGKRLTTALSGTARPQGQRRADAGGGSRKRIPVQGRRPARGLKVLLLMSRSVTRVIRVF